MRRGVTLFAGFLLTVATAGCTAGDTLSVEDVANAASATGKYSGMRIKMEMTMSVPGVPGAITTTAAGVVDKRSRRGRMTVDMTDLRRQAMAGVKGAAKRMGGPEEWRGEQVMDFSHGRLVTYLRVPFMSRLLKTQKPWIKYDLQKLGRQTGIDLQQFTQLGDGSPAQAVDFLRAVSGKVETKGHDRLRGVDTTHYHVTIDLEKYPDIVPAGRRDKMKRSVDRLIELIGVKTVPSDIWIGDDHLIRKMHYVYTMRVRDARGQRQPREMELTMELHDFGATAKVAIPPRDKVFDLAKLIERTA